MVHKTILVGLLLLASVCADLSNIEEEEGVLVLTEKNFDEAIKGYKHILVEFYAPWCGHCKALKPEYEGAAKILKEAGESVRLAKVDSTVETSLAEQHEVRGYPTLKFFVDGKAQDYKGGRKAEEIVSWLKKKSGPATTSIASAADLQKFRDTHDVAVVGVFESLDSDKAKAFERAAGDSDVPFASGLISNLHQELGIDATSDAIVLFKAADNEKAQYGRSETGEQETVSWTSDDIGKWTSANQLPVVIEFSAETAPKIFGGSIKFHTLLFDSKKRADFDAQMEVFRSAARKLRSRMIFILVDIDIDENSRVSDFFGVKSAEIPDIRAIQLGDEMLKYRFNNPSGADADALAKFGEDVLGRVIKPHLLSQELPADWNANPVKVLVASNFDEVARDKSKHAFVEFYAPWCGHCKALAPIWDQLAETYKDREDLVIAKMDATQNEIEGLRVTGFPTLKWFPKGSDEVVEYSGDRSLEALKKFIESDGKQVAQETAEEEQEEEDDEDDDGHGHGHDHDHDHEEL